MISLCFISLEILLFVYICDFIFLTKYMLETRKLQIIFLATV